MNYAYIIDAVRTPIGKLGGTLSSVRADDLGAIPITALIKRNPAINPKLIEDVILGCANQAGEDNRNVARMSALLSGLPYSVGGETINRLCSSGLASVINASRSIMTENGDFYIAGGVENMTRAPFVMSKASSAFGSDVEIFNSSLGWRFVNPKMKEMYGTDAMGETAENLVDMFDITREDQDKFAYNSQMKAHNATINGRFSKEIVAVEIKQKKGNPIIFDKDEFIRPDTTLETLSTLKPAFRSGGSVTAGNASGLNDGAAAMILASKDAISEYGLKPKARVISAAIAGVEPRIMGIGPVEASRKALKRAGLSFDDLSVIELNEAFAAQSLACIREFGLDDNDPRINPNGGAIALGHPLGMSGARLVTTAMYELIENGGQFALCTMCIGVGQGYAAIIERV